MCGLPAYGPDSLQGFCKLSPTSFKDKAQNKATKSNTELSLLSLAAATPKVIPYAFLLLRRHSLATAS